MPTSYLTSRNSNHQRKRLCVAADGIWKASEANGMTTVQRLVEAIPQLGVDGVQQSVFFDGRVSSRPETGWYPFTGEPGLDGLEDAVVQLYIQLALNYEDDDEIYLFGFSRGAFIARSLSDMLHAVGLLRRSQLHLVSEAYSVYRTGDDKDIGKQAQFRTKADTHKQVLIRALVCFETIGERGIPSRSAEAGQVQLHDTTISPDIHFGLNVLSIDEDRASHTPTPMTPHPSASCRIGHPRSEDRQHVSEVYFCGGHKGIGGWESSEKTFADFALRFVVDEMHRRGCQLEFDQRALPDGYPKDPSLCPSVIGANTSRRSRSLRSRPLSRKRHTDPSDYRFDGIIDGQGEHMGADSRVDAQTKNGIASRAKSRSTKRDRIRRFVTGTQTREVLSVKQVHWTAIRHYQIDSTYRPKALHHMHDALMVCDYEGLKKREFEGQLWCDEEDAD